MDDRFKYLSPDGPPVMPEGCIGELSMKTTRELIAEREAWFAETVACGACAGLGRVKPERARKWYLGAMNDGLFVIDVPPRPSTDDVWHDRPDGPSFAIPVSALGREAAQRLCDLHNAALGRDGGPDRG